MVKPSENDETTDLQNASVRVDCGKSRGDQNHQQEVEAAASVIKLGANPGANPTVFEFTATTPAL
jgi:hypothetical protein